MSSRVSSCNDVPSRLAIQLSREVFSMHAAMALTRQLPCRAMQRMKADTEFFRLFRSGCTRTRGRVSALGSEHGGSTRANVPDRGSMHPEKPFRRCKRSVSPPPERRPCWLRRCSPAARRKVEERRPEIPNAARQIAVRGARLHPANDRLFPTSLDLKQELPRNRKRP